MILMKLNIYEKTRPIVEVCSIDFDDSILGESVIVEIIVD